MAGPITTSPDTLQIETTSRGTVLSWLALAVSLVALAGSLYFSMGMKL